MVWTPLHHIIKVCGPFENGNGSQNSAKRWGHVRLKFDGAETGQINVQLFAHIRIGPCGRFWSWLSQRSKGNLEPDITRVFYFSENSRQSGNDSKHVWRGHGRAWGWSFTVAAHLLRELQPFLKQQPCCSRKESYLPCKDVTKSFRHQNRGKTGREGITEPTFMLKQTLLYIYSVNGKIKHCHS